MKVYECSRQIEATIRIEAESVRDLLHKLSTSADALVEQADGVAFASNWSITEATEDGPSRSYEVSDVDIELGREESFIHVINDVEPTGEAP
ncbi:hypothetical protein UFOVP1382_211 [uncultured Caudovirales phage]|uniref:Uncharacterized protein n=1 Tax=uncultured Caudovirales phage TaxID=2100421 RepID=A0A6J5S5G8_9CAUD|nr:hypothetical protein UFOVP1382_211 [uncultured Caudovirales phage]